MHTQVSINVTGLGNVGAHFLWIRNYIWFAGTYKYVFFTKFIARCSAGEYRVGHDPGTCEPCPYGHWRADHMNATICEPCLDTLDDAEMYTTVNLENWDTEVMGATNYSQCRGNKNAFQ